MSQSYLRRSIRLPVTHRGTISDGHRTLKCLVQDVSGSGMLIVSTVPFAVGQILDLECETEKRARLACKIEIRSCEEDGYMGAKIVKIGAQSAGGYQHYVDAGHAAQPQPSAVAARQKV